MKNIFCKKFIVLAILISTGLPGFSQDKFGGMTLYTLRNEMGTDPQQTLKKVADVGYKFVEAVDYKDGKFYNMSPKAFKKHMD